MNRRPNTFIVGFPKCGTTSLCYYLEQHPDVFVCNPKELHFFSIGDNRRKFNPSNSTNRDNRWPQDLISYEEHFKGRTSKRIIDGSTTYIIETDTAKKIKAYNPSAKIIIMIRNPAIRSFSAYCHMLKLKEEQEENFRQALKKEEDRISKNYSFMWRYKTCSFYYNRIQSYYDQFGPKQIYLGVFEDFVISPQGFLRNICKFLSIDTNFSFRTSEVKNESRMMKKNILTEIMASRNSFILSLKRALPKGLKLFLKQSNTFRLELEEDIKKDLMQDFESDLKKLEEAFEIDLTRLRQ